MPLSREVKIFYAFLLKEDESTSSYVTSATATICKATRLAIDANGKCHAFNKRPAFDGKAWQPANRHKVFVFTLPKQVPFVAADTQFQFRKQANK
jgi:hypothetical protein